jgi:glyoxylate/hydroxypyruvate reductase A
MRILLHRADGITEPWIQDFDELLPEAEIEVWREGRKDFPCDYAVLWMPPLAMVPALAHVKAIFNTGAGVDALLKLGDFLPHQIPIVRLGDAGMGAQMAEYVTHAVLRYFRRFDEYEAQARQAQWHPLPQHKKADFSIGLLGMGVLGRRVLQALTPFGFPLRAWHSAPGGDAAAGVPGVTCFSGEDGLDEFLRGTRVLVDMLPLTPATNNLLDRRNLSKLQPGAYLINVARGAHVAESELLTLIQAGHIAAATLDVFRNEPLPAQHPFWREPRITITPHISALTLRRESIEQIAAKIRDLEAGKPIADVVNRHKGY